MRQYTDTTPGKCLDRILGLFVNVLPVCYQRSRKQGSCAAHYVDAIITHAYHRKCFTAIATAFVADTVNLTASISVIQARDTAPVFAATMTPHLRMAESGGCAHDSAY